MCLIFNLPEMLNSGKIQSGFSNVTNFFTQRQLSKTAISGGLTLESIPQLTQYNNLITQGVTRTQAFKQTMIGATDATKQMALRMANGTVQLNELTTASKAAQLGMSLLNATMNIVVSFIISAAIKQMYEWAHSFENAAEKADNAITKLQERKDENNQLQELIDKYKQLKEAETSENKQETRKQTLELQKEITNLIAKQPGLYDKQLKNIDLVNGKLDEQLDLLGKINQENSKSVVESAAKAYRDAADAANEYKYDVKGGQIGGKNVIWLDGETENGVNDANGRAIIDELLNRKFVGNSNWGVDSSGRDYYNIEFAKNTNWIQRLKFLDEAIEALEQSAEFDTSQKGLYDQLLAAREDINKVVGKEIQAATDYAQLLTESVVQTDMTNVKSYSDFIEARKKVIDELSNDGTIKKALLDGALSDEDIENYVNEYISSLDNVSTYYDAWVRNTAQATQSDYEKAKSMLSLEDIEVDFDYSEYKEKINETTDSLGKLSSAYAKLVEGNATSSDILSIVDNFPELSQYANDTKTLTEKVKELGQQKAEPLLTELRNLAKTVKDPEQKAQVEGLVVQLERMAGLSEGIKKTADAVKQISVDDYIKYEEDNIQKIIDKLEKEKDSQNDVLDSLKQQKETLEQTISEYEKVADVVGKYIDRTQIQPLEDRKSELEEYYNTQIEKLKEENDERDRNIELQEKQNALANARKNRVRVQTETEGWVWKNDNKAIRDAEKDLADYQNNMSIENLEKARDKEVKNIDDQIKSWEKYKDEWKKQVEAITEADNELIASKVLGADWQEQVSEQNIDVMTNYGAEYASYNNQLKNQVNVEIAATEKAIKEREKEISDWKEHKTDVSNLNKEITDSNNEYLDNFNQFVLDENSTWEDRIEHMEQNVAIIKRLNREANSVGGYGLYHGNEFIDSYSSEEEAEQARRKEAEKIAKRRTKSNVPDSVLETIIQSIMSSMTIERYATGGVNIQTGLSWLDGSNTSSEVVFNSSQAKQLYDIVRNGDYSKMLGENILSNIRTPNNQLNNDNQRMQSTSNTINISFAGANINAESYESFKDYMDRYTGDLFLQLQTGKK